jgi:DNA-binding PadR family transcriptional regulator
MMKAGPLNTLAVSPLQVLMMLQLNNSPKYGYEMLKIIRDEFDGVWELKTGTFYPALRSLETRGFVETNVRDETEFYSLTEEGKLLLWQLGDRFQLESKFTDRYFRALIKWAPDALRKKVLRIIQTLSKDDIDVFSNLHQLFIDLMDREKKLEALHNMRRILKNQLIAVEQLYQEITDGEED